MAGRRSASPALRRVLIIEDNPSRRSMLFAFLTSMQCECRATTQDEALGILKVREFDAILVGTGPAECSVQDFLARLGALGPGLLETVLVITEETTHSPNSPEADWLELPHVASKLLFQHLWSNLQNLFTPPDLREPASGRRLRLVFDNSSRPPVSGSTPGRHLIYRSEELFVDLQITPQPQGRIEIVGQLLGSPVGAVKLSHRAVKVTNSEGSLSIAFTDALGEFRMELVPKRGMSIRIETARNSWLEAPLRSLA